MIHHVNRRKFLAVAGSMAAALPAASSTKSLRLGAPVFLKSEDPAELAQEHRRLGYSAAYCPPVQATDKDKMRAIEQAFARENVVISEVGAWKNILDPDSAKRKENLQYVMERCVVAEGVGALCCVDIAGSYNPNVWYGPHPKNLTKEFFEATVENCRHIIDAVKPKRTKFTVEMMGWSIPDSPDSYVSLIKAVDRPAFGVHLDVCNGINCPARFYGSTAYIQECFKKLGPWIVSCHAKDLQWITELNVHFLEVIPGRGQVDYNAYLVGLSQLPQQAPLMLEHLKTAEEYEEGKQYILKVAQRANLQFA